MRLEYETRRDIPTSAGGTAGLRTTAADRPQIPARSELTQREKPRGRQSSGRNTNSTAPRQPVSQFTDKARSNYGPTLVRPSWA